MSLYRTNKADQQSSLLLGTDGCREKLGVDYGQNLEMGLRSIIGIVNNFITIFALITPFFNLLSQNAVDIQTPPLSGRIYLNSTVCLSRIPGDI